MCADSHYIIATRNLRLGLAQTDRDREMTSKLSVPLLEIEQIVMRLWIAEDDAEMRSRLYDLCVKCSPCLKRKENSDENLAHRRHILMRELSTAECRLLLSPHSRTLVSRIVRICSRLGFKESERFYKGILEKIDAMPRGKKKLLLSS